MSNVVCNSANLDPVNIEGRGLKHIGLLRGVGVKGPNTRIKEDNRNINLSPYPSLIYAELKDDNEVGIFLPPIKRIFRR